ncbi:MAG: late promoter transcription accessory protein [Aeromonas veronii]
MTTHSLKTDIVLNFPLDAHERASIAMEIEARYNSCPEYTYLEILTQWAEENDVGEEDMVKYCIAEPLKQKLHHEAVCNKLLKKEYLSDTNTLDSFFG